MAEEPTSLDTTLLRGFRYTCRPGCGLCCFAEPRVEPGERPALLRIAPAAELFEMGGASFLRARPEGAPAGSWMGFAARPTSLGRIRAGSSPCMSSSEHASRRASCSPARASTSPPSRAAPRTRHGLDRPTSMASSLRSRSGSGRASTPSYERRGPASGSDRAVPRAGGPLGRRGGSARPPSPPHPPARTTSRSGTRRRPSDGLELLPLYYGGRAGPVALAGGLGGWEALELRPSGGVQRHLGSIPPPTVPPSLTSEALALLVGYLRYFLERDLLFAWALPRMVEEGEDSVTEWVEEELRRDRRDGREPSLGPGETGRWGRGPPECGRARERHSGHGPGPDGRLDLGRPSQSPSTRGNVHPRLFSRARTIASLELRRGRRDCSGGETGRSRSVGRDGPTRP